MKDRGVNMAETDADLITEARSFLDKVSKEPNPTLFNDQNTRHHLNKFPLWEKAKVKQLSVGKAVIIPLSYDKNIKIGYQGNKDLKELEKTSYILIYRDKQNEMQAEWVTLVQVENKSNVPQKFAGTLIIEDWRGNLKRSYAIGTNGKISPLERTGAVTVEKIAYGKRFGCIRIEHYGTVTVGSYTAEKYLGSEIFCFPGGGEGGDDDQDHEQETPPDENPSPEEYLFYDCHGDLFGTAVISNNCGCIGGNTGIPACIKKEIKVDTTVRKCIDTIATSIIAESQKFDKLVGDLMTRASMDATAAISRLSQLNNFKINIGEWTRNDTQKLDENGDIVIFRTNAITDSLGNIHLNTKMLNDATDLAVAATLIHEMMHSYFIYAIKNSQGDEYAFFREINAILFDDPNYPPTSNILQHGAMATTYVNSMADLLNKYALSRGILTSPDGGITLNEYCRDMFWGTLSSVQKAASAPNEARATSNRAREDKNTSNSTRKKKC